MIDRYSRETVDLQTWINRTLGLPDPAPLPVVITLMDMLTLAAEYHARQRAAQDAADASQTTHNGYRPDMTEAEFADWLRARRAADEQRAAAEQAAWDAYRALEFAMLKHAADTPRVYSGVIDGQRVKVMYEPVNGQVEVLVGDEVTGGGDVQ